MKTYGEVEAMLHTFTILNTVQVRTSAHPVRFIYVEKDLRRPSHGIRRRSESCGKKSILCPRQKSNPDFSVTKTPPLMPYVKSHYL